MSQREHADRKQRQVADRFHAVDDRAAPVGDRIGDRGEQAVAAAALRGSGRVESVDMDEVPGGRARRTGLQLARCAQAQSISAVAIFGWQDCSG